MYGPQLQQIWNESLESETEVILALGPGRYFEEHGRGQRQWLEAQALMLKCLRLQPYSTHYLLGDLEQPFKLSMSQFSCQSNGNNSSVYFINFL